MRFVGLLMFSAACAFPEPPSGPSGTVHPSPGAGEERSPDQRSAGPTDARDETSAGPSEPASREAFEAAGGMRCYPTGWTEKFSNETARVRVAGRVDWSGELHGSVLIDLGDPDSLEPVYGFECRGTGAFDVQVPESIGAAVFLVFVDNDMNGPSASDPQVRSEGVITMGQAVDGLIFAPVADAPISGATFAGAQPD